MFNVTFVKPNAMHKIHGMNITIQLKVQNRQNTFETTSAIVLHDLSFEMLRKILRTGRT